MIAGILEDYESTFALRFALGVAFFVVMGAVDVARHGRDARRAKEYLFLAFAALCAVAYGVAHDHVTATISPAYFLEGKGLRDDPRPYRLAVTVLAARATYWVGLLLGAAMLIANNPRPALAQLPYGEMARLCVRPIALAALCAVAFGALFAADVFGLRGTARSFAGSKEATRFLFVWGVHTGSYLGGLCGGIWAVTAVVRRRRARAA